MNLAVMKRLIFLHSPELFTVFQILLDYEIRTVKQRGRLFDAVPLGTGRQSEQEVQSNLEFMGLAFK